MKAIDQPILTSDNKKALDKDLSQELIISIHQLVLNQPYAVLCTQTQSHPYGSLVAFATSPSLKQIIFATPVTTRKYHFMKECPNVAMLIDSRHGPAAGLMEIEAVTATGVANEVTPCREKVQWAELLVKKHQYLGGFLAAETCSLFVIEVDRYLHVSRFQEVSQWLPK